MDTLFLLAIGFIATALTHYLGFNASEEFFFLERKYARGLFFVFLLIFVFLIIIAWIENSVTDKIFKFLAF